MNKIQLQTFPNVIDASERSSWQQWNYLSYRTSDSSWRKRSLDHIDFDKNWKFSEIHNWFYKMKSLIDTVPFQIGAKEQQSCFFSRHSSKEPFGSNFSKRPQIIRLSWFELQLWLSDVFIKRNCVEFGRFSRNLPNEWWCFFVDV